MKKSLTAKDAKDAKEYQMNLENMRNRGSTPVRHEVNLNDLSAFICVHRQFQI